MASNEVIQRLAAMNEESNLSIDAIQKSLRCYETAIHPLLKERLHLLSQVDDDLSSLSRSSSYSFYADTPWKGNNLMNYLLQSFFDQEVPEFTDIIYLRCSKKTSRVTGARRISMESYIWKRLRDHYSEYGRPISLVELARTEFGGDITSDLFGQDYKDSTLAKAIHSFMVLNDYHFPVDKFLHVPGRKEVVPVTDLEMDTRYYPARMDNRAFCKDRNLMRHLSGCCLHRLILPQDVNLRRHLHRNNIIPSDEKDMLDVTLRVSPGTTSVLILGDVSNFTGSAANAWVLLHVIALQLSERGLWDKSPNLFSVKGTFLTATWRDIIITYLYTTVGMPCYIPGNADQFYLPGGYLGVAANITVGLLYLAMVLNNLRILLSAELRDILTQAGGDDFCFAINGDEVSCEKATDVIRQHIINYVGKLKEFRVIRLDEVCDGPLERARFCRKQVCVKRLDGCTRIYTERTVPIPESMLRNGYVKDHKLKVSAWHNLHYALAEYEKYHPENSLVSGTLRKFFFCIYPELWPPRIRRVTKSLSITADMVTTGEWCLTRKALDRVATYDTICIDETYYLDEVRTRINHGLRIGDLLYVTVPTSYGQTKRVIIGKNSSVLRATEYEETIGIVFDPVLLADLVKMYNNY